MEGDKPTRDNILRICRRHAFLEPARKGGFIDKFINYNFATGWQGTKKRKK